MSTVNSPLFTYSGINDMVEGWGPHEIFVSVWRRYPHSAEHPTGASDGPNQRWMLSSLLQNRYLGFRGALGVLRCVSLRTQPGCALYRIWLFALLMLPLHCADVGCAVHFGLWPVLAVLGPALRGCCDSQVRC